MKHFYPVTTKGLLNKMTKPLLAIAFFLFITSAARATTYYLTAAGAGNAQTPSSWNTAANGTGAAATSFTNGGDVFIVPATITNGVFASSVTFGSASGSGSGVALQILGSATINTGVTITMNGKNANNSSVAVSGTIIFGATAKISLNDNDSRNSFTLAAGATLKTANVLGVLGANCSIERTAGTSPTVTLTNGANYEFNGAAAQATLGLPATGAGTINTLTINNAAGVSLTNAVSVTTLTIGSTTANSVLNDNGKQITSSGTFNLNSGTLNIGSGGTNTAYPAFGVSNISTNTTVNYNSSGSQQIAAVNYYNLSNTGGGARSLPSGTVGIAGSFSPGAGNYSVATGASGNTVIFNGTAAQTIPAITNPSTFAYWNLGVNNSAGISSIASDITVANTFFLTKGVVTTGGKTIIISSTGFVSRPPTTGGWVNGNLQKPVNTTNAFDFEIGDASNYCPVNIQYTSLTTNGSLTATVTGSPISHPAVASSGLDPAKTVTRYWTLTNSGVTGTYNAAFTFASGDIPSGAAYTNFDTREYNAGAWVMPLPPTISRSATSTKASGFTNYGQFIVGESYGAPAVTVNPDPTSTICDGGNTSFTSSSSSLPTTSIQWQVSNDNGVSWNDITSTTDGGKYSGYTSGTLSITGATYSMNGYRYRAKFTNINGTGYSTTSGGKLIVNALPVITSIAYTQASYSTASPAQSGPTFGSGSSNYTGGTYSVSPAGLANFNTTTGAFTPIGSSTGTYTITYQVTNGVCAPVSAQTTVTISDATISYGSSAYCNSVTSTVLLKYNGFTANPSATYTVSSVPAGANLNNTGGNFVPANADPAVYTVTYTDGSVSLSTNVTVTQLPSATISYSPNSICSSDGSANLVTYSGTAGAYTGGTFAYTPSVTGNVLNIVKTGGTTSNPLGSITGTGSDADNYNVTYKIPASGGCPSVTTSPTPVTVVASPTATLTYGTGGYSICKSMTSVSPVVTGLPSGGSYSEPSGQTGLSVDASGVIDPSSSTPGTYNMIYTVNSGTSCGDVQVTSADIVIVDNPSLSISYSGAPFCTSDGTVKGVTFTGTGSHAGTTFSAPSGLAIDATTGGITPASSTANTGNPYQVTATIPNCPLATPITTFVEIDPSPSASISYDAPSFCELDASQHAVTITGTTGGTFTYSPSGSTLNIDQPTGGSITPSGSTTGNYTVNYKVTVGACSTTASTPVTITPKVGPTTLSKASGSTEPTCQITSSTPATTYTATATNATGFLWSISPASAGTISSSGVVTWTAGFNGTVTISVQAQGCGGSTTSDTRFFTINPTVGTPTTITIDPSSTEPTCQLTTAGTTTLYGTTATDNTGFNWSLSNASAGSINSSGLMTWANGFSGPVDIRVTASGCNGPSTQVIRSVTITPIPGTPTISGLTTPCQGSTGNAYSATISGASSYTWSYTGTGATITGSGSSINISFSASATSGNLTVYGSSSCGNGPTATYPITIKPLPGTPSVSGNASVCVGSSGVSYSATVANATGYSWSYSGTGATISGTGSTVTVSFSATATSGNLTVNGTNSCGNGVSTNYPITVSPVSNGGIISPAQAFVCPNGTTGDLTVNGIVGSVVKWQTSVDPTFATGVTDVASTSSTLSGSLLGTIATTTYVRAVVQSGTCGIAYTAIPAVIVVNQQLTPTITYSPGNPICLGTTLTVSTGGFVSQDTIANGKFDGPKPTGWTGMTGDARNNNGAPSAQWGYTNQGFYNGFTYVSNDGTPYMIVDGTVLSTLTTNSFSTVGRTSLTLDWYQGYNFNSSSTGTVDISIDGGNTWINLATYASGTSLGTNPMQHASINLNQYLGQPNVKIRFKYNGTAGSTSSWGIDNVNLLGPYYAPTYTWNSPLIQSGNTATITPTSAGTFTYSINVAYAGCTGLNTNFQVVVNPTTAITTQPVSPAPYCQNASATALTVAATGTAPITYQWFSNTTNSNVGGTAISGATTSSYTPPTAAAGTVYYYVVVTGGCGNATSNAVKVVVNPSTAITTQPVSPAPYCQNVSATALTVVASGTAPVTYQWFSNTTNNNAGGTAISGATSSSYTPSTTAAVTTYYYVVVTGGCGNVTSNAVTVVVNPSTTITTQPVSPTPYCQNTAATALSVSAAGYGTLTYQWYSNITNSNTGGTAISSAISSTYTPSTANAGTFYYYVVVTGGCGDVTSNAVTVVINPSTTIITQPVGATYCQNATSIPLSVSASGYTILYQWFSNSTNSTTGATSITGANSSTYTPPTSSTGTTYYFVQLTGGCGTVTSSIVPVTIGAMSWTGTNGTDWNNGANWCSGVIPTATTDVDIPPVGNLPVLTTTSYAHNITIESGANITLNGQILTITGAFTGSTTGYLTGSASSGLITSGATGTLYFDQTTPGATNVLDSFNVISGSATLGNALNMAANTYTHPGTVLTSGMLNTGGLLTLKSVAGGDAVVGPSSGSIIGNVTVERFIPARRAWRFLSAPFESSSQTINQAWQDSVVNDQIICSLNKYGQAGAGWGTQITYDNNPADGYDQNTTYNPSIKVWKNGAWTVPVNTYQNIVTAGPAYCLFVRGDRTICLSQAVSAPPNNTTLRITGQLNEKGADILKSFTSSVPADFAFVANPYASPINIRPMLQSSSRTTGIDLDKFWVWDPGASGNFGDGQYVVFSNGMQVPNGDGQTDGSYGSGTTIQSGQAFFVQLSSGSTTGSVKFQQGDKNTAETNVFNKPTSKPPAIYTNLLNDETGNGGWQMVDGVGAGFGESYSAGVDAKDAQKQWNNYDNMALVRDGARLAIEFRPLPILSDTLFYKMFLYKNHSYALQIFGDNLPNMWQAWMVDKYLNSMTKVNLYDTSLYNFTTNSDTNSYRNRFMLVYRRMFEATPVKVTSSTSSSSNGGAVAVTLNGNVDVYPNPTQTGSKVLLKFTKMPAEKYQVTVTTIEGKAVLEKTVQHEGGNYNYSLQLTPQMATGTYLVKIRGEDGYSATTKLVVGK